MKLTKRALLELGVGVVLVSGLRIHTTTYDSVVPVISVLKQENRRVACGTGTTGTWYSNSASYLLEQSADESVRRARPELDRLGFQLVPMEGTTWWFERPLPNGGEVSVRFFDHSWDSGSSAVVGIGFPKMSWYGLKIPFL